MKPERKMKTSGLRLFSIFVLLIMTVPLVHAVPPVITAPVVIDSSGLVFVDKYLSSQAGTPDSLATDSNDNLVAFYTRSNVPWLAWSNNDGVTWSNNGGDGTVAAVQNAFGHRNGAIIIDGSTIVLAYVTTTCSNAPCIGVRVIRYTITYSGTAISSVANSGVTTAFSIAGGPEACSHECVYLTTAFSATGAGDGNQNNVIALRDIRLSPNANEVVVHLHENLANAYDWLFRVSTTADVVKAMDGTVNSITKEIGSSVDNYNSVMAIQPSTKDVWVFTHSQAGAGVSSFYSYTYNSGTGNWARTANEANFDTNDSPQTVGTANVAVDTVNGILYWSWFTTQPTNQYEFAKVGPTGGMTALTFTGETTSTPGASFLVMSSDGNVNLFSVDETGQMFYRSYNPTSTTWTTPTAMSGYTTVTGSASLDTTSANAITPIIFGVSAGNLKFGSIQFDPPLPPATLESEMVKAAIIGAGIIAIAMVWMLSESKALEGTLNPEELKSMAKIIIVIAVAILIVVIIAAAS